MPAIVKAGPNPDDVYPLADEIICHRYMDRHGHQWKYMFKGFDITQRVEIWLTKKWLIQSGAKLRHSVEGQKQLAHLQQLRAHRNHKEMDAIFRKLKA